MALNPGGRSVINARVLPRFPGRIIGQAGIKVETSGGVAAIKFNLPGLTINNTTDIDGRYLASYDEASGEHERMPLGILLALLSAGDMLATIYDPNGHEADAFARANHTGTQTADTITDGTTNKAYTGAEQTKLAGVANGATANDTNANLKSRANHTGTQSADTITDGTANKVYTAAEMIKLAGISAGATANSTDAFLRSRSNHTGTQPAASVTGLAPVATTGAYSDLTGAPGASGAGVNLIKNPGFKINQRAYAGGSLALGVYAHDRWKSGVASSSYSVAASGNINIATIAAGGSFVQVIEGAEIDGGSYTVSWVGTSQCKVNGAAAAASPITATLPSGTDATLEFTPGTLSKPLCVAGTSAGVFASRPITTEELLCKRYYFRSDFYIANSGTTVNGNSIPLPVAMRTSPSVSFVGAPTISGGTVPAIAYIAGAVKISMASASFAVFSMAGTYEASAEL